MSNDAEDEIVRRAFMREALNMAELALASDETPVGCVFVYDGRVIARGMNDTNRSLNGSRHAEFVALADLLAEYPLSVLRETDLSVYYGCANDKFGGTGGVLRIHDDPGVDPPYPVYGGYFREEAIMLLRRFYVQENGKAPEPHRKSGRVLDETVPSAP